MLFIYPEHCNLTLLSPYFVLEPPKVCRNAKPDVIEELIAERLPADRRTPSAGRLYCRRVIFLTIAVDGGVDEVSIPGD